MKHLECKCHPVFPEICTQKNSPLGSLQKVITVSIPVFVSASAYCPLNAIVQQPQNWYLQLIL